MRLVLIESPYMFRLTEEEMRGLSPDGIEAWQRVGLLRNVTYARLAMRDCVLRGEAPYASHLLLPQPLILDDDVPAERRLGIDAGLAWGAKADATAVYLDLGTSAGMRYGIANAEAAGRSLEERRLPGWEDALSEEPGETLMRLGLYSAADIVRVEQYGGIFGPQPHDEGFAAALSR